MAEEDPPPVVIGKENIGDDDDGDANNSVTKLTYKEKAIAAGRNYTVTDVPPLGTSIILGVQHYLTMLGATVSLSLLSCSQKWFSSHNGYLYTHLMISHICLYLTPLVCHSLIPFSQGVDPIDLMSSNGR